MRSFGLGRPQRIERRALWSERRFALLLGSTDPTGTKLKNGGGHLGEPAGPRSGRPRFSGRNGTEWGRIESPWRVSQANEVDRDLLHPLRGPATVSETRHPHPKREVQACDVEASVRAILRRAKKSGVLAEGRRLTTLRRAWVLPIVLVFTICEVPSPFSRAEDLRAQASGADHRASSRPGPEFKVLYSFTGGADGGSPVAGLTLDAAGNLFGTTYLGGNLSCNIGYGPGCGTVFEIRADGNETVLHSFMITDGAIPVAGLYRDAQGNLYGTTYLGGNLSCTPASNAGCGTVFELDSTNGLDVLHEFTGLADGAEPTAGVTLDAATGSLDGTAGYGGQFAEGVAFSLRLSGRETVLHAFSGGSDGGRPMSNLMSDSAGDLYGTAPFGGTGCGVVFKLNRPAGQTVLYTFTFSDGCEPYAPLIGDQEGNLYGTTWEGGASGVGTVFKIDTAGAETVLYSFQGQPDGENTTAGLVQDSAGNLYGTTFGGGEYGHGIVFKLSQVGEETVLHSFTGGADGGYPEAGLVMDRSGTFYGTTNQGGSRGNGTVFAIRTSQ